MSDPRLTPLTKEQEALFRLGKRFCSRYDSHIPLAPYDGGDENFKLPQQALLVIGPCRESGPVRIRCRNCGLITFEETVPE